MIFEALQIYKERFKPSKQLKEPYAMVGVNVVAADTDEEAHRLASSQFKSFVDYLGTGNSGPLGPPVADIESYGSPQVQNQVKRMLACTVVGSKEKVKKGLEDLIERTGASELIIVTDIFDKQARQHSFELVASLARESAAIEL